jgi:hypothetical protein
MRKGMTVYCKHSEYVGPRYGDSPIGDMKINVRPATKRTHSIREDRINMGIHSHAFKGPGSHEATPITQWLESVMNQKYSVALL